MTNKIFKAEIKKLSVFFNKPLNPGQLDIWYDHLRHLPDKVFQTAVGYIIRTNKFFPTPEEFLIYHREFHPRMWEDVKEEYGLSAFTSEELKANKENLNKISKAVTGPMDINKIIGDKK